MLSFLCHPDRSCLVLGAQRDVPPSSHVLGRKSLRRGPEQCWGSTVVLLSDVSQGSVISPCSLLFLLIFSTVLLLGQVTSLELLCSRSCCCFAERPGASQCVEIGDGFPVHAGRFWMSPIITLFLLEEKCLKCNIEVHL